MAELKSLTVGGKTYDSFPARPYWVDVTITGSATDGTYSTAATAADVLDAIEAGLTPVVRATGTGDTAAYYVLALIIYEAPSTGKRIYQFTRSNLVMALKEQANGSFEVTNPYEATDEVTTIELDTTLSVEGKAADAKAVGDALAALGGGSLVEPAEDDIPKVFLTGNLPTTKDEVTMSLRYISKTEDVSGYVEIKCQGNSSMSYPKKNFTVKMFADEALTEKMKVDFKGWGKQNKHVYKANWIDITHARNVVSARLWADVVKSRANYAELPELLRTSPNQGAVDGFPIKVYSNGVYQGRYTLNIPKDKWMANMDDDLDTHCILCGEGYSSGCFRSVSTAEWTDEIHDTMPATIANRWKDVISFVMNSTDEDFKANLGNYFDVQSLIDYHLYGLVSCGLDAYGKNQLYMTYDGQKWIASMYDMDSTWGLYWNGGKFVETDYARTSYEDMVSGRQGNLLYMRLEQLFYEELQTRWEELKTGALSIENIINRFERFTDITPAELVKEDYASTTGGGAFTGIPSQSTNNIQQIRAFALARQAWTDEYVAGLTPVVSVPCTGITLSESSLTFTSAGSQTLVATVEPTDTTDAVVWSVTPADIATVADGVVTAVANGSCTITVTCGEQSAACAVSVSGIGEGDEPGDSDYTLPAGHSYALTTDKTFDGKSDYVDTGVMLFDTDKDFSVFIDFTPAVITGTNINLFNCQLEQSPYPGLNIGTYYKAQYESDFTIVYRVGGSGTKSLEILGSDTGRHKVYVALNAATNTLAIKVFSNGSLVQDETVAHNSATFNQNALLGAWQDTNGTKGRYWTGTIHACGIWEKVLTDEEVASIMN